MAGAILHPTSAEIEAIMLGMMEDATFASVETHIMGCSNCQERAVATASDNLIHVFGRVHAQGFRETDTLAQTQNPGLASFNGKNSHGSDRLPAALANHERYRVVRLIGDANRFH